ncbi:HAMP domain-containing sensor histidine kinase [Gorillibacterium timonense]|uniref:HAMP domain-containing sensor histidine kinase n=1 Tax=Gorillibacterium timonense TaxID=1689269 RepID=UPI00071DA158|nr:HAMP domain-containing sensor histidine kinase [Gorillibacterium timonense]
MRIRKGSIWAVAILIMGIGVILFAFRGSDEEGIDLVAVNDITQSLVEQWGRFDSVEWPGRQYGLDYAVLDNRGDFLGATRSGLNETVDEAIRNRDTIVDITQEGTVLGKLILYNHTREIWGQYRDDLLLLLGVSLVFITLFCLIYAEYIDRSIFRPFRKLQAFARHVAEGKLDMPLEMEKGNGFGAFAESFDIMREELAKARESERMANQSKKELVASLSHDIKTPIASIKAVSEVMMMNARDEEDRNQLDVINSKADQINTLITNLFNATLEELQQLTVAVTEESSAVVGDVIKQVDYLNKATIPSIPECIIRVDRLRFLQVVDNVISNSYKYAGTPIVVSASIKGQYLEMGFKDAGQGVSPDELPLLFNKFYRAKNSTGKSGTGLGLYISHYLMSQMSGEMDCRNVEGGFMVTVRLLLA